MADTIPVFGKQIPVVVFTTGVGLVSALIAAGIALLVNHLSNRQQTKRLKLQLEHDAEQKDKERKFGAKRDIFLEAANEVAKAGKYLTSFHEFSLPYKDHAAIIADYGKALTRIHLIGGIETIRAVTEADKTFQMGAINLQRVREPFLRKQARSEELRAQISDDLQSQKTLGSRFEQIQKTDPNDSELFKIADRFKFLQNRIEQAQNERKVLLGEIQNGVLVVLRESRKAAIAYAKQLRQTNIVARKELGLDLGESTQEYFSILESVDRAIEAEIQQLLSSSEKE